MENISDWLLNTIREDEKRGVMSGWIEEKRFLLLPHMVRLITHILQGRSVIVLTDRQHQWFGTYITQHINQHHKGRPFLPVIEITHLRDMIDSNAQGNDMKGFKLISNMLDMMYGNYKIWYIGKKSIYATFAKECGDGWHWIFDENEIFNPTDEYLDYKLLILFKLFDRAILRALLNKISLDI